MSQQMTRTTGGGDGPRPGEIVPYKQQVVSFRGELEKMKAQLALALPKHVTPDRIVRIVMTEIQKTPRLLDCTRESVFGAVLQAAQLGLEPGGPLGQAYLVPYKNNKKGIWECQLIPGYKGLIKLAYQSGEVGAIRARVVWEKDKFSYEYGLEESVVHVPHRGGDPGMFVAVYAVAKIKGVEEPQFVVMERWEIDEVRQRSKASDSGPWVTDFPAMAMKTALRRLCKMLPASVEKDNLAKAIVIDERAEAGLDPEYELPDSPVTISDGRGDAIEGTVAGEGETPALPAVPSKLDELANQKKAERQTAPARGRQATLPTGGKPADADPMPGWAEGKGEAGERQPGEDG